MNRDSIEPGVQAPRPTLITRTWGRSLLWCLISGLLGALAVLAGHRFSSAGVVDLGPTDGEYVRGFRDVERDGLSYFRWSTIPESQISAPVRFCGPGSLRLRVRRHLIDPALLTVSLGGTVVGQRSIRALEDRPYDVIEFPVSRVICDSDVSVLLETSSDNDRPLGVAVDWIQLRGKDGFRASNRTAARGAVVMVLMTAVLGVTGGTLPLIVGVNAVLLSLLSLIIMQDPVAGERILRSTVAALGLTMAIGLAISYLTPFRRTSRQTKAAVFVITLATLLTRAVFFHPQAFYPDYRVHALVQQTLNRQGMSGFLDHLFEIQYARSLGLQQVDGHWYPFPYPPGAYALAGGVSSVFGLDALDASQVSAATAAALIPLMTAALGLALGLGEFGSAAGAFFVAFQPLLVRRMALGYYPGLVGQLADAVALLLLISVLRSTARLLRGVGLLTVALLSAFLVYTQSIANFGLLLATLMLIEVLRPSVSRAALLRAGLVALLALSSSVTIFYSRYAPVAENLLNHRTQPEERVLERLEELRQLNLETGTSAEEDQNDPYAGSTLNPFRGLARLGSRLWRFNGPFVIVIAVGLSLLWREGDRSRQNLGLAWAGVAIWISLLAAGLPSPNGFQHLKDLEFASPLAGLACGAVAGRLWTSRPRIAAALAGAWLVFAVGALAREFVERLLPVLGI